MISFSVFWHCVYLFSRYQSFQWQDPDNPMFLPEKYKSLIEEICYSEGSFAPWDLCVPSSKRTSVRFVSSIWLFFSSPSCEVSERGLGPHKLIWYILSNRVDECLGLFQNIYAQRRTSREEYLNQPSCNILFKILAPWTKVRGRLGVVGEMKND